MEPMENYIGAKLKARREELGWAQDETAEKAGLTGPTISRVETGARSTPQWATIAKIARALGLSLDELYVA